MIQADWPEDIKGRILADFGQKQFEAVRDSLANLWGLADNQRIIRCVLFLAQGNRRKLEHFIEQACLDVRDVIYWAEYDGSGRINDFNRPFRTV